MTFLRFHLIGYALMLLFSGHACAQFSQPPPSKAAPVCSEKKRASPECKNLPVPAEVTLSCQYEESPTGFYLRGMRCTAIAWRNIGGGWSQIDPSLLKYYWASIVDGQEYYSESLDAMPTAYIFCGSSGQGYVRVTVSGGTAVMAFQCASYEPPSGQ
jgi:hypothetical protein